MCFWVCRLNEDEKFVKMHKKTDAEGFFDDGLTYLFLDSAGELQEVRPRHIYFEIMTDTPTFETCDLRFYSVEKVPTEAATGDEEDQ